MHSKFSRRHALIAGLSWPLGPAGAASPVPGRPLTIWFTVQGAHGMRKVAERFTALTGVPVVVETPDEGPAKFQQAASAGKGPDIYAYTHDRIGEWVAGGLLAPVSPPAAMRADVLPQAWDGFTWRGRTWGYPYAIEAVTLVYNKALVAAPPASFDEVFALDAQLLAAGKRAMLWDYTNNYC
jgi:maltose/maltodextrin transport system substrate-binding protein